MAVCRWGMNSIVSSDDYDKLSGECQTLGLAGVRKASNPSFPWLDQWIAGFRRHRQRTRLIPVPTLGKGFPGKGLDGVTSPLERSQMADQESIRSMAVLKRLYEYYDACTEGLERACRKGCSTCCTCNVTLTSLETAYIAGALAQALKDRVLDALRRCTPARRYHPALTINGFARACVDGIEPPEEENNSAWGRCPLLDNETCSIYEVRPFNCRSLVSKAPCCGTGEAVVSPLTLTLNTVFMQYIEHVDAAGTTGNLSDMLSDMLCGRLETGCMEPVRNQKAVMLMVPPEHRAELQPVVAAIAGICQS